jgi:predicted nucleic acid-binding protein
MLSKPARARLSLRWQSLKSASEYWRSPAGKKRRELERWFSGTGGPQALFANRVLPFDEKAGLVWARLMADGTSKGRPRSESALSPP